MLLTASSPGDRLTVLNASNGANVVSVDVPVNGRFRFAKFRDQEFAVQKDTLKRFLAGITQSEEVAPDGFRSDLLGVLGAFADMRRSQNAPVHALIVASPIQIVNDDPPASMRDGDGSIIIPSDGMLLGSLLLSPYGRQSNASYLEGVTVHICAVTPDVKAYEQTALAQFWGRYINLRGGVLVTFNTDIPVCLKRFQERLNQAIELEAVDRNAIPAMVQASRSGAIPLMRVDERASLAEQLNRERVTNQQKVSVLEGQFEQVEQRAVDAEGQLRGLRRQKSRD